MSTYRTIDGTTTTSAQQAAESYLNCADLLLKVLPVGFRLTAYEPGLTFHDDHGGRVELQASVARTMAANIQALIDPCS